MAGNMQKGGDGVPRVYDKNSGEYRPVFGQQGNRQNRNPSSKYATPQLRAETRRRRRRRALLIFYLFVFITVIAAAAVLSLTVLFKIDSISVTGTSRYSAEEVIQTGGIKKGENLFLANTAAAQKKILQTLPYIGSVKVSRRFPAQIAITVTEEPVSGVIPFQKKFAVVGASGKVLELADKLPQNITQIKGITLSGAEMGKPLVYKDTSQQTTLQNIIAAIQATKLDKVTAIDLTKSYKLLVVYDKRITMNLGLASDLEKKIRFGKSILDSGKIKNTEKGVLDLSTAAEDEHAYFDPDYTANSSAAS